MQSFFCKVLSRLLSMCSDFHWHIALDLLTRYFLPRIGIQLSCSSNRRKTTNKDPGRDEGRVVESRSHIHYLEFELLSTDMYQHPRHGTLLYFHQKFVHRHTRSQRDLRSCRWKSVGNCLHDATIWKFHLGSRFRWWELKRWRMRTKLIQYLRKKAR